MRPDSTSWTRGLAFAALFTICLLPIVVGYALLLGRPEGLGTLLNERAARLFMRTLVYAAGSAGLASLIGVPLGLSWLAIPKRFRGFAMAACCLPFLIPHYVYAIAWIEVAGFLGGAWSPPGAARASLLYSLPGAVAVQACVTFPLPAFAAWLGFRTLDPAPFESAVLARGRISALASVYGPAAAPFLSAGFALSFLFGLSGYSVPALLQVDLYPVEIHTRFAAFYDLEGAFALTLPLLGTGFVAAALWFVFAGRGIGRAAHAWRNTPETVLPPRSISIAYASIVVLVTTALPLGAILLRAGSPTVFIEVWKNSAEEFRLSLFLASASAVAAGLLAVFIMGLRRDASRGGLASLAASAGPLVITGPAFGIGMILLWNHPGMRGAVYDSTGILVIAATARVAFIVLVVTAVSFWLQPRDLDAAAALAGRSPWSRLLAIRLPLAAPGLALSLALAFLFAFGDADAIALVTPPGATPLPVRVAGLMHYGPSAMVAALSLLAAIVPLATIAALALALRFLEARAR